MDKVAWPGECFHRRPAQTVPREVEQVDRHSRVSDRGAADPPFLQTVPPRARKQGERVLASQLGHECGSKLVGILPDTCPLNQRGTIVEQDAHGA
jgi:hypothetical protein